MTTKRRPSAAPAWVPLAYRDEFGVGYGPGWTAATVKAQLAHDRRAADRCPTCDTPEGYTTRYRRNRLRLFLYCALAIGTALGVALGRLGR